MPTRPAATTLIVRDGPHGLEVLMVRRSMQASFMPGAYVFPGGAVDAADGSAESLAHCDEPPAALQQRLGLALNVEPAAAFAVGALRECFEECGLWLGIDALPNATALRARLHAGEPLAAIAASAGQRLCTHALQPWSHWVTPVGLPKRFDTAFFVARAPQAQLPTVDQGETTTLAWVHPPLALQAQTRGEFQMEFATVSLLQTLLPHVAHPVQALLDHAVSLRNLPTVLPRLRLGEQRQILGVLLPGQPGYDQAAPAG